MATTWLLVANRSRARLFEVPRDGDDLVEITDFAHAEGRLHGRELMSDEQGRFYGKGERPQGHSATPNVDPQAHEAEKFAEQLRDHLEQARTAGRFHGLWIVASPAFLGVLRDKLTKGVSRCVEMEIDKDVTTGAPRDILETVRHGRGRAGTIAAR